MNAMRYAVERDENDEDGGPGLTPQQFLELTFEGSKLPEWATVQRDPAQITIPEIHPAFGMRQGEVRVHDGVIVEHSPDGSRNSTFIAGVEAAHQPKFQAGEIDWVDDASSERIHEEHERYATWLANYSGRNLPEEKLTQLREHHVSLTSHRRQLEKGITGRQITRKGARASLAKSMGNLVRAERQLFSDQPHELPLHSPLRNIQDERITPELIEDLERAYEEYLEGTYLRRDQVQAQRMDTESSISRIGREEEYYKAGRAFYKYKENPITFFDPGVWRPLFVEGLEIGSTWTFGEPEFNHWEFRVYTAEHSVLPVDWEWTFFPVLKHIGVVAGAWVVVRRKATENIWEGGQITETKEYTRWEENFFYWVVGHGCAGYFLPEDELVLKYVAGPYANLEDLQRFAFGVTPTGGGRYFPIRAVPYCVGTYGLDWVCHQLANAFTLRRWNIIVVHDSPFESLFGLVGRKDITERRDLWGGIHQGCIPGNWCYYTTVPPYATDPGISAAVEAFASGTGLSLRYFWNPKRGEYCPTRADWKETIIPFVGPNRVATVPGWNP